MKQNIKQVFILILFVLLCQSAGLIGSLFTFNAIQTWYAGLARPEFSPPNWLFGPVWITLYTLMGVAMYLVYRSGWENKSVRNALYFFTFHLGLNTLWSIVFFGAKKIDAALLVIIVLWVAIVYSIKIFGRINKYSAWLLVPYLLWVSFATYLNFSFSRLN